MLPAWYNQYRDFIEDSLSHYFETYFERSKHSAWCDEFKQAVQYSLQGWKKLRAILALEFYLVLNNTSLPAIMDKTHWSTSPDKGNWGVCIPDILRFCMAIEIIHAYSLVHDDLPCMDNDTLRRGKATVWKKYGEYQAVLVGDLLNSLAFEILSEIQDAKLWLQLSSLLSKAVWFHGMLWWQVDDMYFEKYPEKLSVSDLMNLHNKKTWALIKASVQWGILVSWKVTFLHKLSGFGEKLWLAFQIKDDILDVEWSVAETGKSVGWEQKGFVHFMWLSATKQKLWELIDDCLTTAQVLRSKKLMFLVDYVGKREK